MKLRHIRTAAAAGIVIIALGGASGCGSDTDKGSASSEATDTAADAPEDTRDATKDVEISDCAYVEKQGITAKLSASNPSATMTYTYNVTVKFTAPDGTLVATQTPTLHFVRPGRSDTQDVTAPYTPKAGAATSDVTCEVTQVTRGTG
ncbi:hypothetical protein [Streptomyces sp. NPDC046261]|uniref:hypothetical protein n=1 Tax=Streptomyces sp. NPDC046261 TaxID=3157200 RepID=UPI0033F4A74B